MTIFLRARSLLSHRLENALNNSKFAASCRSPDQVICRPVPAGPLFA
jgi:hypothetical protein